MTGPMRYTVETSLRPGQVYARARDYFGPEGPVGLTQTERALNRHTFAGGGGFVVVSAHPGTRGTRVVLEAWQFDREAQQFIAGLPAPGAWLERLRGALRRR